MASEPMPWYDFRVNLHALAEFMLFIGLPVEDADGVPYFLEKPWKWENEWNILQGNPDYQNYSSDAIDELREHIMENDA